jgi:hypothetical protein
VNLRELANRKEVFSGTLLFDVGKKEKLYPMLYVAQIENIECPCQAKCGKYKIGYVTSPCVDKLPAYHRSRIKSACPNLRFFW